MGESDGAWGELVSHDSELAEAWDGFRQLPAAGENVALDAFIERKRISHGALVRIGARLAADTTIAFGGPGYIKFRDLVSGERWVYAGSDWTHLKVIRAGVKPTEAIIVVEGETDAARVTEGYDLDVAMLPAGAGYFPETYAASIREYQHVLVSLDTDAAGERGATTILDALPQAQRFAPPENDHHDWCGVAELPPLPELVASDVIGGLYFEDLRGLLTGGVPEPEVMVDDLLYTEGVHWISGHPGSGKTTLTMYVAILVMLEGRHVVWLDYEGGVRPTLRRLIASQCPVDVALERFHYAGWPKDAPSYLDAVADRWPHALVVIDSASKALQSEGFDENSPSEVTGWVTPIVKATKQRGLPAIVIDHVVKQATQQTRYSRGAGSKLADADVAWFVNAETPFNRTTVGSVSVHQQKDREGYLPFTNWYQIGDGDGGLPVVPIEGPLDEVVETASDVAI